MENGVQITPVVVLVLHILHKKEKRNTTVKEYISVSTIPRSTIPFSFSSESEASTMGPAGAEVQTDNKDKPDSDAAAY